MSDTIRLNIGAGDVKIDGFTPIDRKFGQEAYPLDYPDGSVDEIRASHILEHFTFDEALKALKDWFRALKPSGKIRVSVPDFDKIITSRQEDEAGLWRFYLMGGQTDTDNIHRSVFTEKLLYTFMHEAGFVMVDHWESANTDTAAHPISVNLQGMKPIHAKDWKKMKPFHDDLGKSDHTPVDLLGKRDEMTVKIKALMSVPRYGPLTARGIIERALRPFGIGLETSTGVFWGQCMQRMFEKAITDGIDWVLCIDYDSLFTCHDLDRLMGALGNNPHIDALAALEPRRGGDRPLMTVGKQQEVKTDGSPIKATTAHFGLTLIRTECLKDVKKPWFYTEPEEGGTYGDERLDDDIWFWHQWRLAGKNIYIDPTVKIGHLEEAVAVFGNDLEVERMSVSEWREKHP